MKPAKPWELQRRSRRYRGWNNQNVGDAHAAALRTDDQGINTATAFLIIARPMRAFGEAPTMAIDFGRSRDSSDGLLSICIFIDRTIASILPRRAAVESTGRTVSQAQRHSSICFTV